MKNNLIGITGLAAFIGLLMAAGGIENDAPCAVLWALAALLVLSLAVWLGNRRRGE